MEAAISVASIAELHFGVLVAAEDDGRTRQPRKRTMDLAIAATANAHKVRLLAENIGDFQIISDLVDARSPHRFEPNAEPEAPQQADWAPTSRRLEIRPALPPASRSRAMRKPRH